MADAPASGRALPGLALVFAILKARDAPHLGDARIGKGVEHGFDRGMIFDLRELGGFRMGPFELMDFIGNDINYTVTETVFTS